MSIIQALFDQVEREVRRSGHSGRVLAIQLVVGRLSGIHVDALRFAFELLSPQSIAAGAELGIEQTPAELVCGQCGSRHPTHELQAVCPHCGSGQVTIEGGQELLLQSIELED